MKREKLFNVPWWVWIILAPALLTVVCVIGANMLGIKPETQTTTTPTKSSPPPTPTPTPHPNAVGVVISTTVGYSDVPTNTKRVEIIPGARRSADFTEAVRGEKVIWAPTYWDPQLTKFFAFVDWTKLGPQGPDQILPQRPETLAEERVRFEAWGVYGLSLALVLWLGLLLARWHGSQRWVVGRAMLIAATVLNALLSDGRLAEWGKWAGIECTVALLVYVPYFIWDESRKARRARSGEVRERTVSAMRAMEEADAARRSAETDQATAHLTPKSERAHPHLVRVK